MNGLSSELVILAIVIASALGGGLLVWIAGYVSGGSKDDRRQHRRPPAAAEGESEAPAPAGEQELLCVSRMEKGSLAVFVQDQRYHRLSEVQDPQVRSETIAALKAVLTFAEGWLPSAAPKPPQPVPTAPVVEQAAFLTELRQQAPSHKPESRTFVDEINDLVQQRLQERPALAEYRIRLTTGKDGSLRIHMGQQTFDAVGDVSDLEVRALIQDAIREWDGG
jgi:hypothetical protein